MKKILVVLAAVLVLFVSCEQPTDVEYTETTTEKEWVQVAVSDEDVAAYGSKDYIRFHWLEKANELSSFALIYDEIRMIDTKLDSTYGFYEHETLDDGTPYILVANVLILKKTNDYISFYYMELGNSTNPVYERMTAFKLMEKY